MKNPCKEVKTRGRCYLPTVAERLLDLAEAVQKPRGQVICAEKPVGEWVYARIKLALDFEAQQPAFKVRAIVEAWDQQRIVREIY